MLDPRTTLSDKLLVLKTWLTMSVAGDLPSISETPRVFLDLLEDCRTEALAFEAGVTATTTIDDDPHVEHPHPVSSVYVPEDPSRGTLGDMGRPTARGFEVVDIARFRRLLRPGVAR